MTEADVLKTHSAIFYEALKNRDFDALEKLYSEDYMLVRADGSVLNKQAVLKDLREQGLTFQSIELTNVRVRLFGSTAILTGESKTLSSRGLQETQAHFRLIAVYVKNDDAIHLAHFQSTTL
jgi:ketosteroid isomerase-like protein